MALSSYIKESNHKYQYRRRLSKDLQSLLHKSEVKISLGANRTMAIQRSISLTATIDECSSLITALGLETSREIVLGKLEGAGVKISRQSLPKPVTRQISSLKELVELYLLSLTCSPIEARDRKLFLAGTLPYLAIPSNMIDIKYSHIKKLQQQISRLPKRNIEVYRQMPIQQLVKASPIEAHRISTATCNKYVKWIKSLFVFAINEGLLENNPADHIKALPLVTVAKQQRLPLTLEEYRMVRESLTNDSQLMADVLYLSGMRRSEVYKCVIHKIDGILCFDLRQPTDKLKTQASYRVIPVHSLLISRISELNLDLARKKLISNQLKESMVKAQLEDINRKSLYSLRHSFGTELIANRIDSTIVSELMGHRVTSITMNRYVQGYPVKRLQEAIETLSL